LICWAVVLSTRPRSSCWENKFGTSWWVVRSRNLTELWGWRTFKKYSKSKSLNLNCEAKDIFNRQVSLDSTFVGLEPPIISSRIYYARDRKVFPPNIYVQILVLVTRCLRCYLRILEPSMPRNSCWENNFNFGASWWIMRSWNINRKIFF
jgi:hypothetical protein